MSNGVTVQHDLDLEALKFTWDARHEQAVDRAADLVARTVADYIREMGYLGPMRIRVQRVTESDVAAGRAPAEPTVWGIPVVASGIYGGDSPDA